MMMTTTTATATATYQPSASEGGNEMEIFVKIIFICLCVYAVCSVANVFIACLDCGTVGWSLSFYSWTIGFRVQDQVNSNVCSMFDMHNEHTRILTLVFERSFAKASLLSLVLLLLLLLLLSLLVVEQSNGNGIQPSFAYAALSRK